MTYEEIFAKAQSLFGKGDATGFDGDFAIQVNITGEGEGAFYIAYKNGALDIASTTTVTQSLSPMRRTF